MVKIAHASIDERNKIKGGQAGDQTGKEVCIRNWYDKNWNVILRPKSNEVAKRIVKEAKAGANNDNIGYDQNQRNTLLTQAKKVNFDLSKIRTQCECDCSSFVSVLMIAAGAREDDIVKGGNCATTSTLRSRAKETGMFDVLTHVKYLNSDKYLKAGDIVLKEGSHVVIVIENGVIDNDVLLLQKAINKDMKPQPLLEEDNICGIKTKAQMKKVVIKKPLFGVNKKYPNINKFIQRKVGSIQDGEYGPDTKKKVELYQKQHQLKVDGIVGINTLSMMIK